jgi:tetratricopeptide (TPR) repeat protein
MAATASPPNPNRWLFGPASDLLIGCGGLYVIAFLIIAAIGPQTSQILPEGLIPLGLVFAAVPHYGSTLLRVYERSADRRRYAFFAVWATALVWGLFVWGVYDVLVGSLLLTLYLSWSPWHYSGQNYGIGVMMLGRAGVVVPPRVKRLLYASFLLSFLLVLFSTHAAVPTASYSPTLVSFSDSAYRYMPVGIPLSILGPLLLGTTAGYLTVTILAIAMLRRTASWADLAPLLGVVVLQNLWFALPVVSRAAMALQGVYPLSVDSISYMLLWYAFGHSFQYLWVTTYYAKRTHAEDRRVAYWAKAYFAGASLFAVPAFLFSPLALGTHSFESGLGMLIASAVNLHHFILDGAIWKLRDGRIARVLLRKADPAEGAAESKSSYRRRIAWSVLGGLGVAYAVFYLVGIWEIEHGFRRALDPPNAERMRLAAHRLAMVGHDHPGIHLNLAVLAVRDGDLDTGVREAERSIALGPSVRAHLLLGQIYQERKQWADARRAYESALAIDPQQVIALAQAAFVSAQLGDLARAERELSSAVALAPGRQDLRDRLDQLHRQREQADGGTEPAPATPATPGTGSGA